MANNLDSAPSTSTSLTWHLVAAFFIIYFVWGTTFLAIREVVHDLPPIFAAGIRFFVAGSVLFSVARLRGETQPQPAQWKSLAILAVLMFVMEYGLLFWAEQYISSSLTCILEATIPIFTVLLEMVLLKRQPLQWKLVAASFVGAIGVGVLVFQNGSQHTALLPCLAVLLGSLCWAVGSVLNRSFDLPSSNTVTAGATMMLGGIVLLLLSVGLREFHEPLHPTFRALLALAYLIIFGSLLGFTAFVWLLTKLPAARVSSHAYVNPLVAVAAGAALGSEPISMRMVYGGAIVLISVLVILSEKT
jgi:drug/metabolite transporter (DMT)-like permease